MTRVRAIHCGFRHAARSRAWGEWSLLGVAVVLLTACATTGAQSTGGADKPPSSGAETAKQIGSALGSGVQTAVGTVVGGVGGFFGGLFGGGADGARLDPLVVSPSSGIPLLQGPPGPGGIPLTGGTLAPGSLPATESGMGGMPRRIGPGGIPPQKGPKPLQFPGSGGGRPNIGGGLPTLGGGGLPSGLPGTGGAGQPLTGLPGIGSGGPSGTGLPGLIGGSLTGALPGGLAPGSGAIPVVPGDARTGGTTTMHEASGAGARERLIAEMATPKPIATPAAYATLRTAADQIAVKWGPSFRLVQVDLVGTQTDGRLVVTQADFHYLGPPDANRRVERVRVRIANGQVSSTVVRSDFVIDGPTTPRPLPGNSLSADDALKKIAAVAPVSGGEVVLQGMHVASGKEIGYGPFEGRWLAGADRPELTGKFVWRHFKAAIISGGAGIAGGLTATRAEYTYIDAVTGQKL